MSTKKEDNPVTVNGGTFTGNFTIGGGEVIIHNSRPAPEPLREPLPPREKKMAVDIAIITVREDEFRAVLQRFETERQYTHSGLSYYMSRVQTLDAHYYRIAITRCSEQGNDVSQKLASDIIHELNPRLILVVGIAGGIPQDDFTLGDVIVSTRVLNFNVDAMNADGTTTTAARGGSHPLVAQITGLLPGEDRRLASWNTLASIGQERPDVNLQRPPLFKIGPIASSNHLVKNSAVLTQWLASHRQILAVEMETAGVYEAAQMLDSQYPVMAIRGISDIVGLPRDPIWTAYACQTAASFTRAFIMTGPLGLLH